MPRPRRTQVSLGTAYQLKRVCEKSGYQRAAGLKNCQTYFPWTLPSVFSSINVMLRETVVSHSAMALLDHHSTKNKADSLF